MACRVSAERSAVKCMGFLLYVICCFFLAALNIFSLCLVFLGEGNGNPLHYSHLENPVDRGPWWAAIYGVAQSRTWLKWLSMHACIGEGNGSPLQCSCLENPRDGGAWGAAIYGVTQSWTRLKWLSSSSFLYSPTLTSIHDYWKKHSLG